MTTDQSEYCGSAVVVATVVVVSGAGVVVMLVGAGGMAQLTPQQHKPVDPRDGITPQGSRPGFG